MNYVKSLVKIKSSDGDEFEVTDDVVKEIETLNTKVKYGDEEQEEGDYKEQVLTCAMDGMSLKKILVWTECQIYFKQMDLKEIFKIIVAADFLSIETLSKEMCKKSIR